MAGFIPDSLPPVSIFTQSPRSPYHDHYGTATSPVSLISMSSPATFLARPHTRASGTYSRPHHSELPTDSSDARPSACRPDSVSPALHIQDPLHYADKMKSSPYLQQPFHQAQHRAFTRRETSASSVAAHQRISPPQSLSSASGL
jgi:hypothetical protein